jgi:hypothetical protein
MALAVSASAAERPATLVSAAEADPIHSAILRNEAWTQDAVRRLRTEAERCMKEGPWTVTAERPEGIDLDPHLYYSESPASPAGRDLQSGGQAGPARFDANRAALRAMSDAVFTLGTAAFLLDDARYAQRAGHVIQTWFVAPKTRMEPNFDHAQTIPEANGETSGGGPLEARPLIRAIQGMEFLAQSGQWDSKEQAAVERWFGEYLRWLTQSNRALADRRSGGTSAVWWAAEVAATASFVQDAAAQQTAFNYYRRRALPREVRAGVPAGKGGRTPTPAAAMTRLDGLATVCRVAQVRGVDLWTARTGSGATVATLAEALETGLANPRKWSPEQIDALRSSELDFLAFAGMGLNNPSCIALFRKLERPTSAWLALVDLLVGRWEASANQTRH